MFTVRSHGRMRLFLRKLVIQERREGRTDALDWSDREYAVVAEKRIGVMYQATDKRWFWFLQDPIGAKGIAADLDQAKADFKAEYERWKAPR